MKPVLVALFELALNGPKRLAYIARILFAAMFGQVMSHDSMVANERSLIADLTNDALTD
jgi:hypothetical protein